MSPSPALGLALLTMQGMLWILRLCSIFCNYGSLASPSSPESAEDEGVKLTELGVRSRNLHHVREYTKLDIDPLGHMTV